MMKLCELCKGSARIHCEADQASLCWNCDAMVHSANFIVARHSRNLLCNVCKSPMPWSCSGAKLKITVSVCEQCNVVGRRCDEMSGEHAAEENQTASFSPPPPSSESSSSGGESGSDVVSTKRRRHQNASRNRLSDGDYCFSSKSVRPRRRRCNGLFVVEKKK